MKFTIATALAITPLLTPLLAMDTESAKRLDESAAVFSEVMATPDKGIPQEMLENAHCIVIQDSRLAPLYLAGSMEKDTSSVETRADRAGQLQGPSALRAAASAFRSAVLRRT